MSLPLLAAPGGAARRFSSNSQVDESPPHSCADQRDARASLRSSGPLLTKLGDPGGLKDVPARSGAAKLSRCNSDLAPVRPLPRLTPPGNPNPGGVSVEANVLQAGTKIDGSEAPSPVPASKGVQRYPATLFDDHWSLKISEAEQWLRHGSPRERLRLGAKEMPRSATMFRTSSWPSKPPEARLRRTDSSNELPEARQTWPQSNKTPKPAKKSLPQTEKTAAVHHKKRIILPVGPKFHFLRTHVDNSLRGKKRELPQMVLKDPGVSDMGDAIAQAPESHEQQLSIEAYARSKSIPIEVAMQALEIFQEFSGAPCDVKSLHSGQPFDFERLGSLNRDRFTEALCKLAGVSTPEALNEDFVQPAFKVVDMDNSGAVDFPEFSFFLNSFSFKEEMLVGAGTRELRAVAREQGIPYDEIERYKSAFDKVDQDSSGEIEFEEFKTLIRSQLRVHGQEHIPHGRLKSLWSSADLDRNGALDFNEFVTFYRHHFLEGYHTIYRNVRRVPVPVRTE